VVRDVLLRGNHVTPGGGRYLERIARPASA